MGLLVAAASHAASAKNDPRVDLIWSIAHNKVVDQIDVWWDAGDYPRIVQLQRLSYNIDPTDYEVATDLGWMLENVEQYDEALAVYVDFRKQNPEDPDSAYPEANFYFRQKAYAKVPSLLEPRLKAKPHRLTYQTLAHSYERMDMLADSQRVWKSLIQLAPNDTTAKGNLKRVESKIRGDYKAPGPVRRRIGGSK